MKSSYERFIVITGGAGFIGSCLVKQLNREGFKNIILVDDLGVTDKWKNLLGKNFKDMLDKSQLFGWLNGKESMIESIIHLGACSKTVEKNASYLLENNYRYTVHLAEYAVKNQIRFIYASSAATYGDGKQGFNDEHENLEDLRPLNMYGMSKHMFDLWAKREGVLNQIVGLKFFNVFGPNEWHKGRMASAIMHVLPTVQREGMIRLFKSNDPQYEHGGQMRDFVYVKDVVRMIAAFMANPRAGGIFNVASGKATTWNELAYAVFSAVNKPANIEYIEMPEDLAGKYQNYTCADMAKTRAAIGSAANCMPLNEAVKDYVENHLLTEQIW